MDGFYDRAKKVYDEFSTCEKIYFSDLNAAKVLDGFSGVYAIFDKNDGKALYVGRTKNLRKRMYGHLRGPKQGARLKKYLAEDKFLSDPPDFDKSFKYAKEWIKENCYFKYIVINCVDCSKHLDCLNCRKASNERGHVEGLLGFILDSKYIETEH